MDATELARWLTDRLSGPQGRSDWRRVLEGAVEAALDRPLSELVPEPALREAVDAHLTPEVLAALTRAVARASLEQLLLEARADAEPVDRWLSDDARAKLDALLERPGWVDEAFVRELFAQKAAEDLVSDTLYAALKDFSTLVPRVVQSVLPAGIGKLAKLSGKAATAGVGGRVLEEVERRLEAEIRRFLGGGTRRALERAATFTSEHADSPTSIAARKNVVAFSLSRPPEKHLRPVTDDVAAQIVALAEAVSHSVAAREEARVAAHRIIRRIYEDRGDEPLRAWMEALGGLPPIPYDAWAEVTFSPLVAGLESEVAQAWLEGLSQEILDRVRASDSGPE